MFFELTRFLNKWAKSNLSLLVIGEVDGGSSGTFNDCGFIVGELEEITRGLENPNIPTFRVHISSKVASFSGINLNLKLFEARSSRDEVCIKML